VAQIKSMAAPTLPSGAAGGTDCDEVMLSDRESDAMSISAISDAGEEEETGGGGGGGDGPIGGGSGAGGGAELLDGEAEGEDDLFGTVVAAFDPVVGSLFVQHSGGGGGGDGDGDGSNGGVGDSGGGVLPAAEDGFDLFELPQSPSSVPGTMFSFAGTALATGAAGENNGGGDDTGGNGGGNGGGDGDGDVGEGSGSGSGSGSDTDSAKSDDSSEDGSGGGSAGNGGVAGGIGDRGGDGRDSDDEDRAWLGFDTDGGDDGEDIEGSEESHRRKLEQLRQVLIFRGFEPRGCPPPPLLPSFDLEGFADTLRSAPPRSIIVLCGAGISVSAGIPDFRSPGTGLYDNLQKYDLPSPQAIFELSYFRERPDAFYTLAKEMWPDNFIPTPTHHFIALLHHKGMLRRCFSQNIDSLEAAAGLPHSMVIAAHGNFDSCTCIDTGAEVPVEEVRRAVAVGRDGADGWQALQERHGGLVKPNIVFFGEQLPARFFEAMGDDLPEAQALIIMGTSLKVQPFASLVGRVSRRCPRLLINRELVGTPDPMLANLGLVDGRAILHGDEMNNRDAFHRGDCDEAVRHLAALLGWDEELEERIRTHKTGPPAGIGSSNHQTGPPAGIGSSTHQTGPPAGIEAAPTPAPPPVLEAAPTPAPPPVSIAGPAVHK